MREYETREQALKALRACERRHAKLVQGIEAALPAELKDADVSLVQVVQTLVAATRGQHLELRRRALLAKEVKSL